MLKVIIGVVIVIEVFLAFCLWCCCRVAGQADDSIENIHRMEDDEERGDTDAKSI